MFQGRNSREAERVIAHRANVIPHGRGSAPRVSLPEGPHHLRVFFRNESRGNHPRHLEEQFPDECGQPFVAGQLRDHAVKLEVPLARNGDDQSFMIQQGEGFRIRDGFFMFEI
jgi:hypothetical protein